MMLTSMMGMLLATTSVAQGQPAFEHRGAYLNIAYGFSAAPLSPDTWSAREWIEYLDGLSAAGLTHLHFFLWGDVELSIHDSDLNAARNAKLHRRLRVVRMGPDSDRLPRPSLPAPPDGGYPATAAGVCRPARPPTQARSN